MIDAHRIFDIGADLINHGLALELDHNPEVVLYGKKVKRLGLELRDMGDGSHVTEMLRKAGLIK